MDDIELAVVGDDYAWIKENYINVFARFWNTFLDEGDEMRARVHICPNDKFIAVEFFPADKTDEWDLAGKEVTSHSRELAKYISSEIVGAYAIFISGKAIVVVRKNYKHLWSQCQARQDAECTQYEWLTQGDSK